VDAPITQASLSKRFVLSEFTVMTIDCRGSFLVNTFYFFTWSEFSLPALLSTHWLAIHIKGKPQTFPASLIFEGGVTFFFLTFPPWVVPGVRLTIFFYVNTPQLPSATLSLPTVSCGGALFVLPFPCQARLC